MDKVYGIHRGCIHEGGGCFLDVYTTLEGARRRALIEVGIKNDQTKKANKEGFDFKLFKEVSPNRWVDLHDEIQVITFKLNHRQLEKDFPEVQVTLYDFNEIKDGIRLVHLYRKKQNLPETAMDRQIEKVRYIISKYNK